MDSSQITNLVFEGGGVSAIAYAGFLAKAENSGRLTVDQITRVAGVSSGAMAALQVALNYSTSEITAEMRKTDFKKFIDSNNSWAEDILRLFTEEGLYNSEDLYRYIGKIIKTKTGDEFITFHDLQAMKTRRHFKDLYVVATKLFLLNSQPTATPFTFSHEHTPYARVIDAVRASAALPFIFPPVRLYQETDGKFSIQTKGDVYVDGGVLEAYPIDLFDQPQYIKHKVMSSSLHPDKLYNPETLGLRLESPANIRILQDVQHLKSQEKSLTSYLQYAEALLYGYRSGQQEASFVRSADRNRTIIIDTMGITTTDFSLTAEQKEILIQAGEKAALQLAYSTEIS